MKAEEFFEHHGVRGQKWGVRKSIAISEKPWSSYSKADYSREQWHNACLIHNHTGPSTSKNSCKLPVKTPDGVVNRHGVFAAAAVLAGSRGGVQATPAQKEAARKALLRLYSEMDAKPPESLKQSNLDKFLEHYGIKGMRWESTRQETLDRIYRVAQGTATKREKQKEMLKLLKKDVNEEAGSKGKVTVKDILNELGAKPLSSIVPPE